MFTSLKTLEDMEYVIKLVCIIIQVGVDILILTSQSLGTRNASAVTLF